MEIALLIEGPGSAATLRYLRSPKVVGARDRDCKCDNKRHNHPAKNSTEEESHLNLIPFVRSVIEANVKSGLALLRLISNRVMETRSLAPVLRGYAGDSDEISLTPAL